MTAMVTVTASLKNALKNFYPSLRDPAIHLDTAPDQFFLKTLDGYLWGKVYTQTLTHANVDDLQKEWETVRQRKLFSEKLVPAFFFPGRARGVAESLLRLPGPPRFFEYGQEFVLRKVDLPAAERPVVPSTAFYRHARLNREELAELIDLALLVKTA